MKEILLIRGGETAQIIDALAVAAEISSVLGSDTQIDIAVPAQSADYAALSGVLRRVIAVQPPDAGSWSDMTSSEEGGLGGKLFSAVKKISSAAGKNARTYWQLAEELRVTAYDIVFDFDFSPFSIAISKVAKTQKIVGFDPQTVKGAVPGGSISAHDVYAITGEMSNSSRMRHLAARVFDYSAAGENKSIDWQLRLCDAPADSPAAPYIAVSSNLPAPFMDIINQSGMSVLALDDKYAAADIAGMVRGAAAVVGSGVVAALAVAYEVKTLFIGNKQDVPHRALWISTPAELSEAIAQDSAPEEAFLETAAAKSEPAATDTPQADEQPRTIKLKSQQD